MSESERPDSSAFLSRNVSSNVRLVLFNLVIIAAMGFGMLYVWNAIVPVIFNGPPVNFIQALGVLIALRLLWEVRRQFRTKAPEYRPGGAWRQKLREKAGKQDAGPSD